MSNALRAGGRHLVEGVCAVLAFIPVLLCRVEQRHLGGKRLYTLFAQSFALLPGFPGVFLRAAFYRGTLDSFGQRVNVSFGALISQTEAIIEDDVYIGAYAIVGFVRLGARTLVGSRASLLSGRGQHTRTEDGRWTPFDASRLERVEIGEDVWIGEAAIVMANVERGAMIGAGSVVSTPVVADVLVAGNPSRFVRRLDAPSPQAEASAVENLALRR